MQSSNDWPVFWTKYKHKFTCEKQTENESATSCKCRKTAGCVSLVTFLLLRIVGDLNGILQDNSCILLQYRNRNPDQTVPTHHSMVNCQMKAQATQQ